MRKRILEQPIDIIKIEEAAQIAVASLLNPKQLKIITLNPEMVVRANKNIEFQSAINNANLIVPDGTGITWAFKFLNPDFKEPFKRVPGIELAELLLIAVDKFKKKLAIYGGEKEVLEKVVSLIGQEHPNVEIVKAIDGFQNTEKTDTKIAEEIAETEPNLVLVALGSPKQEIWINKHSKLFPKSVMIGIGGSLDVWSGKVNRAPQWFRDNNLEWFYRAMSQPKRISRILKSLPLFVCLVFKERIFKKST